MTSRKQISVVKTAELSNNLKLVRDGRVVGSVVLINGTTAELRDHRHNLMGTYCDVVTAVAKFEESIGFEEIRFDI